MNYPKQAFFLCHIRKKHRIYRKSGRAKTPGFHRICNTALVLLALTGILSLSALSAMAADKWAGVDEAVIEKVSKENGRLARPSIINTDKGDLLLFVFLLAGAAGGFVAGYYWRVLTEKPGDRR
jgi:ABC-type cobalt transport system substrate-binding protein